MDKQLKTRIRNEKSSNISPQCKLVIKERTLTFGKYKGQEIKYIILTDIGYIVWCFENIRRFKLTDEEQAIYDAVAIMIKK